jgi:CRISPR/Cas system-associated protein Csm6
MQDEMHERTGVENDEFEDSLLYFVSKDPEVATAMQKYMTKMRQQMGMGGMPGMGM